MIVMLALYPNVRGLGFACLEAPQNLLDYGVVTIRPICNDRIVERVQKFITYYQPTIVLLRDGKAVTFRGKRIQSLITRITQLAQNQNLPVFTYSRDQVKDTLGAFEATTKHEIAQKIVEWFPELKKRIPKIRKAWMDEDYNMGIFDATALALTHLHRST